MSTLYLYNKGTQVHVQLDKMHIQYMGPWSLIRFIKIYDYSDGCISVDTEFKTEDENWIEEDYIDLRDVFGDYEYDVEAIIKSISDIEIGEPKMEKLSRAELIDKSLMVSDNMALMYRRNSANAEQILVVNMKNTNARALVNLSDFSITYSNMSSTLLKRAVDAVKRNQELIYDEIKERYAYA
ncbi:MAG: hypothetical protein LUE16_00720 [Lachnospiraceae bacterium]|nr:hypothetical protein [Lachnospiraceae bacterium]